MLKFVFEGQQRSLCDNLWRCEPSFPSTKELHALPLYQTVPHPLPKSLINLSLIFASAIRVFLRDFGTEVVTHAWRVQIMGRDFEIIWGDIFVGNHVYTHTNTYARMCTCNIWVEFRHQIGTFFFAYLNCYLSHLQLAFFSMLVLLNYDLPPLLSHSTSSSKNAPNTDRTIR